MPSTLEPGGLEPGAAPNTGAPSNRAETARPCGPTVDPHDRGPAGQRAPTVEGPGRGRNGKFARTVDTAVAMAGGPDGAEHGKQLGVANGDPSNGADVGDPWTTPRARRYPPPDFGPALAAARARSGWSLAGLAARCGLSRGYLCRLEHGHRAPSVVTVAQLVEALPLSEVEAAVVARAGLAGVGRDWGNTGTGNGEPVADPHEQAQASVTDHRPGKERNMLDTITACWGGRT